MNDHKTKYSIVCVYNNSEVLNRHLMKSLSNQTTEFELIKINNTENIYPSASEALNYGGLKAKGQYIIFVHQDVEFTSPTWLEDTENCLSTIPDLGIAGVAGMSEKSFDTYREKMRSCIEQGDKNRWGYLIEKPERVQSLDECLTIIPGNVFNKLQFDENACSDWHLYATDYSLSVRVFD